MIMKSLMMMKLSLIVTLVVTSNASESRDMTSSTLPTPTGHPYSITPIPSSTPIPKPITTPTHSPTPASTPISPPTPIPTPITTPTHTPTPASTPLSPPTPTPFTISEVYNVSLIFTRKYLAHTSLRPANMTLKQLQEHLRTFFKRLDVMSLATALVGKNVGVVTTVEHAHALYNLLDLFSALALVRRAYLEEVMSRFLDEAQRHPSIPGRQMNPLAFLIQGFRRHRFKLERELEAFYREMLVPTPANMYFIANFQPKGQPSLEAVMKNLDVDSPFMEMNNSWYILRPADQPALQLAVRQENHLWVLCLTNSTREPAGVVEEEATRERIIEPSARLLGDSPVHLSVKPPGPGEHEPPGRWLDNSPVHPSAKAPGTSPRSPGYYRNDEAVRREPSVGEIKRPSVIVKSSRSSSFS
ncbi:uncharacterized protein LOC125039278 [Penaeus chinensis]|uniref:uncharacterized protein LOC125039278 n=1 Tax=Penaeus chinensis TaxID=139456 RepID=UPI001FB57004|nr:uncharacterized protein LOC125039278 [Penaeus chinensis]